MLNVDAGGPGSGLRLAELVAAFSLATDLGMGQPMEHVLRSWLIAVRLGERMGMDAGAREATRSTATLFAMQHGLLNDLSPLELQGELPTTRGAAVARTAADPLAREVEGTYPADGGG